MDKQDVLNLVNKTIDIKDIDLKRQSYKEEVTKIQHKFLIKYNNAKEEEFESISNELHKELSNLKLNSGLKTDVKKEKVTN